jgi:DNA polymerase I-like protein with 3'-5' exonuclease and polymerase domains
MRKCVADLEANGLLDNATTIWCIVFKDIETKEVFKFHYGQSRWKERAKKFMDECSELAMHHGLGYDWVLLEKLWGYRYKGKRIDTLVLSRLLQPTRKSHSVDDWGQQFGREKPKHEDWMQFTPEMLHRCSEDTEIQFLIYCYLKRLAGQNNWRDAIALTHQLFFILQKQEDYGWLVDRPYMERNIRQLSTWMDRIDRAITPHLPMRVIVDETKTKGEYNFIKKPFLKSGAYSAPIVKWLATTDYPDTTVLSDRVVVGQFCRVSFRPTNLDSGEEVKEFLLSEGWQPKEWNYKKDPITKRPAKDEQGNLIRTSPKLDQADPFIGVNGKVGKLCAKRIQVRHRRSNIEGWVKVIREDGRISGRVSGIAATGRMKHSGIVNVPGDGAFYGKQMRRCFIAKEGFTLIGTDAKSCQDRMLAQRARVQEFTDMLLNGDKDLGTDGHSLAMKAVNKVLSKLGLPLIPRKKGKNFNFAWKFGASDNKLGQMVNKDNKVGLQIRDSLRETFPAQAALVDALTAEWKSNAKQRINKWGKVEYYNGSIIGLDGRPIYISSEHQILVYMLQSDEAIYMSGVYCQVYKDLCERWEWGEDFGIVCFYHDEITIEIKEEYAKEAALVIENAFTKVSDFFEMNHCPQGGEAAIGKDWFEIH